MVKAISSHQLIPSFYVNIILNNLEKKFPDELIKYFKSINELNKERNNQLTKEIRELSSIFNSHKINYVFFKGCANILENIYHEKCERMIGDIDILVSERDFEKAISVLKKNNYEELIGKKLVENYNHRHYPRLVNKSKIFAVEVHKYILFEKFKSELNEKKILKDRKKINEYTYVPSSIDQIKINILSYQINDFAFIKSNYNYKIIYDIHKMITYSEIDLSWIKKNKYINDFFQKTDYLKITKVHNKLSSFRVCLMNIKRSSKLSNKIHDFFCDLYLIIIFRFDYKKFLFDSKYRKFIVRKIKNFDQGDF